MSKHSDERQPPRRRRQRRADVRAGKFEPGRRPRSQGGPQRRRREELQPLPPELRLPRKLPEHLAPLVDEFLAAQPFALDPFQIEAAQQLAEGRSVLVAAPTGTGKTVVAEFAIFQARREGLRAIYTAPIKALSNQKFRDLRALYGEG